MPTPPSRTARIPEDLAGLRLDQALGALWDDLSRRGARRALADGRVVVGGAVVRVASRAVAAGALITLRPPLAEVDAPPAPSVPLVLEDEGFVVVDKPPGMAVQAGRSADLPHLLGWWRRARGGPDLKVVHRLDVPASGLVVLARTRETAASLSEAFRTHAVERRYRLRCSDVPPLSGDEPLIVDRPLLRVRGRAELSEEGKQARTELRRHGPADDPRELTAELSTGRYHQIRAHAASVGAPILGDRRYGGAPAERLHLHACRLAFELDGRPYAFDSPAPWDPALNSPSGADPCP